jgi:ATP-dependent exoDNAse (exonuclease V) beta subunit
MADGCPAFTSRDSVLVRPGGDPATALTVCPGEHRFGEDGSEYNVVWWSVEPDALPLGREPSLGLRRDDLIVKDVAPEVLEQRIAAYTSWRTGRDAAAAAARVPTIDVVTATEAAVSDRALDVAAVPVAIETLADADARPGGARFGTLVHALLADVPLDPSGTDVLPRLAAAHGRVLGADASEVAAALDVVSRTLAHPVMHAATLAARAGRCYRETPVTSRLPDGVLVEGTVDLAFESDGAFVVVDFKTDRPEGELLEHYRRQVALYAQAIGRATGRPARAVLMKV